MPAASGRAAIPKVLPKTVIYDPVADRRPARRAQRDQRHQRARPCRRRAVRAGSQSDHRPAGRGRHPRARRRPAAGQGGARRPRRARALPVRRVAVRHRARQSSAWRCITSCAIRSAAPSICRMRETHTCVLPHALAYNAASAPGAMTAHRARARRGDAPRRASTTWPRTTARSWRCAISASRSATSTVPPTSRRRVRIRIRGRSSALRCGSLLDDAWHGRRPAA